jgi:hypothetical protein
MNWIKCSLILGVIGLTIALTTACGAGEAVPATPTAIPTPVVQAIVVQATVVQVAPSPTPIPRSPTSLPTATALPSRTVVPTVVFTPTPSPKDMLLAAFTKALANLKTYRVEVPQENRYIAVQLPDRFLQEGADGIVKIGGTMWRVGLKGWQTGTGNMPFFDRANINWYKDQFAQSSQVVLLGPGTAEGVACIGYSANFTMTKVSPPKTPGATPEVSQVPMPVKIWFAATDGFPRRIEMAAPLSLTINFFDFNENIKIDPPQ